MGHVYAEGVKAEFRRLWRAGATEAEIERATGIPARQCRRVAARLELASRGRNHGLGSRHLQQKDGVRL